MTLSETDTRSSTSDDSVAVTGRFRKRPVEVSASRWFTNGDHLDQTYEPVTG